MSKVVLLTLVFWLSTIGHALPEEHPPIPRFVMGVYLPGVNDELNTSDIRVTLDYWIKEISHDMNIFDSHTEFFVDMEQMRDSFHKNELDMIIAPPLLLVKHFDLAELGEGFVGVRAHGRMNSLILLVKNDPAINSLEDLRGKKLLMMENDELCELFIDTRVRKLFHSGYRQFFGDIEHKHKNDRLILDLFFGKADAALVYLSAYDVMTELNPQVRANTKILLTYELRAKNYSFFAKQFPYAKAILKNMSEFTNNPRGKQMLELFRTDEIAEATAEELTPIGQLYNEHRSLLGSAK